MKKSLIIISLIFALFATSFAQEVKDEPTDAKATLDEGTKAEMEIIRRCREIINDEITIKELFQSKLSLVNGIDRGEEYKDMIILLKDNSLLNEKDTVNKNDLPYIVKKIIDLKEEKYKNKS